MKKLLVLTCVLMAATAAMAQGNFSFGVKVSDGITNFWGKDVPHGVQANYQAGVFIEYKFNNTVAIAPELLFSSQGGRYSIYFDGADNPEGKQTFATNYLVVPVMLKFYPHPSFSIDLGPQIGFNLYSKYTRKHDDHKETFDIKERTNKIDIGVGLGATYNLTEDFFLQLRYTMGLTNVFKDPTKNAGEPLINYLDMGKAKNSVLMLSAGYRF